MGAPEARTVVLRWTEVHEWRTVVGHPYDSSAVARAAEEAMNSAGIFHRYGVNWPSVSLDVLKE